MKNENFIKILDFCEVIDKQKHMLRYNGTDSEWKDSISAHTDGVMTRAILIARELADQGILNLDLERVMLLAWAHDRPEVFAGDVPFNEQLSGGLEVAERKDVAERDATMRLQSMLPESSSAWFYDLLEDYQNKTTLEAKFVSVVDKIDAMYSNIRIGCNDSGLSPKVVFAHLYKCYDLNPVLDSLIDLAAEDLKHHLCDKNIMPADKVSEIQSRHKHSP